MQNTAAIARRKKDEFSYSVYMMKNDPKKKAYMTLINLRPKIVFFRCQPNMKIL